MNTNDLVVILSALSEPIFLLRSNRQISLLNRAAEELFGGGLQDRDFVHAIRDPDALKCVEAALGGEAVSEAEITLSVPERTVFRIAAMYLEARNGLDAEAVVTFTDISPILEAEQMRSDFVANVSHELRSPLTALVGGIETLKSSARDDAAARERFLGMMEREAARMNRLVGDLLSLSQVEVNAHTRPSEQVNVRAIVERVVATLETRSRAENKTIRIECGGEEDDVPGDEDELTQVFHNLIDNALKYSRKDAEIRVVISQAERIEGVDGPALTIAVSDQGSGIAREHISRLTERFYRVDGGRSRELGGTGLGLAIVKHVLNRHRGRLLIESVIGQGSTFKVCLPRGLPS